MTIKRIIIISLLTLTGMVLALILNFFFLERILIPDPCYYHSHDSNKIFDIFYSLPASEGGHPFPTNFNFIITLTMGAIFGLTFSIYKLKQRDRKKNILIDSGSNVTVN